MFIPTLSCTGHAPLSLTKPHQDAFCDKTDQACACATRVPLGPARVACRLYGTLVLCIDLLFCYYVSSVPLFLSLYLSVFFVSKNRMLHSTNSGFFAPLGTSRRMRCDMQHATCSAQILLPYSATCSPTESPQIELEEWGGGGANAQEPKPRLSLQVLLPFGPGPQPLGLRLPIRLRLPQQQSACIVRLRPDSFCRGASW